MEDFFFFLGYTDFDRPKLKPRFIIVNFCPFIKFKIEILIKQVMHVRNKETFYWESAAGRKRRRR